MASDDKGVLMEYTYGYTKHVLPPTPNDCENMEQFEGRVRAHFELNIANIQNTYEAIGYIASHMYVTNVNANIDNTRVTPYVTVDFYYLGHHMCVALEHRMVHPRGWGFISVYPAPVRSDNVR